MKPVRFVPIITIRLQEDVDMKTFVLRGLPEGLTGCSLVLATCADDVFTRFPALKAVRSKLTVVGNLISGYAACDG